MIATADARKPMTTAIPGECEIGEPVMPTRPHICFVALHAYPAISSRTDLQHIGGAEVQQSLIGRALCGRGYGISFITYDHGQADGIVHDGIRVLKTCPSHAGLQGLRFFTPRWSTLHQAMRRADADIYYQRTAGCETGQVALWCKLNGRPFIFAAASDSNCDPTMPDLPTWRERALYNYGLHRAALVLSQTNTQQLRFAEHFGITSPVVRSCADDPYAGREVRRTIPASRPPRLLWVGRIVGSKKRFDWFLQLADLCSQFEFHVVGDAKDGDSSMKELLREAKRCANVRLWGRVSHADIGKVYEDAELLVCTSSTEGFPNTFLEAWARGLPVLSTVDPDELITRHRLGATASTVDGLARAAAGLLGDQQAWEQCSLQARRYFLEHHSISATVASLETIIARLCETERR